MGRRGENLATIVGADFKSGAPFGEAKTHLIVFGEALVETVETVGVSLERIIEIDETLVDFDAGDDAFTDKIIGEGLAVVGVLAGGFIEKNDATEVIFDIGGSEKDVAVIATVVVGVVDV